MKSKKFIKLIRHNLALRWRWYWARPLKRQAVNSSGNGLGRCEVVFINLDHRTDRRTHIEAEFQRIELVDYTRLSAVYNDNGALGCSMSHLRALSHNELKPDRLLMICEDDCSFAVDRRQLDHLIEEFFRDDRLDVLCLGYNALNGIRVSDDFSLTSRTRTTSCYVVKPWMQEALSISMAESCRGLQNGLPPSVAACDIVWRQLQKTSFFVFPTDRAVYQAPSFSDIRRKEVNYRI